MRLAVCWLNWLEHGGGQGCSEFGAGTACRAGKVGKSFARRRNTMHAPDQSVRNLPAVEAARKVGGQLWMDWSWRVRVGRVTGNNHVL
jgi:hypothetical protein